MGKNQVIMCAELPGLNYHALIQAVRSLDEMIGMDETKETIVRQICFLLSNGGKTEGNLMHTLIRGPPGTGKCLGKGTNVRTSHGGTLLVEDILPGCSLVGDDGAPRSVVSVCKGIGQLFRVEQNRPQLHYVVNAEHILTLKWCHPTDKLSCVNGDDRDIIEHDPGSIVDVSVQHYMRMDTMHKAYLHGCALFPEPSTPAGCAVKATGIISVVPVGSGDYYGFELQDGCNGRFLLSDGTVTHNTTLAKVLARVWLALGVLDKPEVPSKAAEPSPNKVGGFDDSHLDTKTECNSLVTGHDSSNASSKHRAQATATTSVALDLRVEKLQSRLLAIIEDVEIAAARITRTKKQISPEHIARRLRKNSGRSLDASSSSRRKRRSSSHKHDDTTEDMPAKFCCHEGQDASTGTTGDCAEGHPSGLSETTTEAFFNRKVQSLYEFAACDGISPVVDPAIVFVPPMVHEGRVWSSLSSTNRRLDEVVRRLEGVVKDLKTFSKVDPVQRPQTQSDRPSSCCASGSASSKFSPGRIVSNMCGAAPDPATAQGTDEDPSTVLSTSIDRRILVTNRYDWISEYTGGTAARTKRLIDKSEGKVIVIEEAHGLCTRDDRYGPEALHIINQTMTEKPNNPIFTMLGYEDHLNKGLFDVDPGMRRRFGWVFDIPGYTPKQLAQIFRHQIKVGGWSLDTGAEAMLDGFVDSNSARMPNFAGDTQRWLEQCASIHSTLNWRLGSSVHTPEERAQRATACVVKVLSEQVLRAGFEKMLKTSSHNSNSLDTSTRPHFMYT